MLKWPNSTEAFFVDSCLVLFRGEGREERTWGVLSKCPQVEKKSFACVSFVIRLAERGVSNLERE